MGGQRLLALCGEQTGCLLALTYETLTTLI
jgi:hypothetical protein